MRSQVLLHCSNPACSSLIYLDEAIKGRDCPQADPTLSGRTLRYCLECARSLGYRTAAEYEEDWRKLGVLLKEAGMLRRPGDRPWRPVKHRPPKMTAGQMQLDLQ